MAGKELKGREKVVSKMTRDGLTEENLADGSVKISAIKAGADRRK